MDRQQITIEILEKNGFVFQADGMYRWFKGDDDSYYTGYESVHIDLRDGYMNVTKEYDDGKQKELRGLPFSYVDELQSALTLCGIDKTIQL